MARLHTVLIFAWSCGLYGCMGNPLEDSSGRTDETLEIAAPPDVEVEVEPSPQAPASEDAPVAGDAAPEPQPEQPEPSVTPTPIAMPTPNVQVPSGDEIVMLWSIYDPETPYAPERLAVSGDLEAFSLVLGAPPPDAARFPIEDAELGVQTDPNAPYVANGGIYRVKAGMLESALSGVVALDPDKVVGQVQSARLFWTPIDLASTAGVRGFDPSAPIGPLAAGYHLFVGGAEVPLDTTLAMGTTISD